MSDLERQLIEGFPAAAVLLRNGQVSAANAAARRMVPELETGAPAALFFPEIEEGAEQAGIFTAGRESYAFRRMPAEGGELLLFSPAPQAVLTDGQMDGILRQMRLLLSELLANAEGEDSKRIFGKTFYRLFRLLDNLEFMRNGGRELEEAFRPTPMDLVGICRRLTIQAGPLLEEMGLGLDFQCTRRSLLIPGDGALLRRLILELLSNAAREAEKKVVLRLREVKGKAVLSVAAGSDTLSEEQLLALLRQDNGEGIPDPGAGAGLGLSIAHRIAALHKGALLVEWGKHGGPVTTLVLPTGPIGSYVAAEDPVLRRDGGLDPVLVALSDVLPARVFSLQEE